MDKLAEVVGYSGKAILRTLKRELMEIIEIYFPENESENVKRLIKTRLFTTYDNIKLFALELAEDEQSFKDIVRELEKKNRNI